MCSTRLTGNTQNRHFGTIAQLCWAISSELRHVSTIGKNLLNSNISSTCPCNMVNFGLLMAEICWRVLGTPPNFNGFGVLAALLHGMLVVGVSQTLCHWTEGATYIWQGGHHVGQWPTFLVYFLHSTVFFCNLCPGFLWLISRSYSLHFFIHAFFTQSFLSIPSQPISL